MEEEAKDLALETGSLLEVVLEKLEGWVTGVASMLPNLAVALLVVIAAALAARLLSRLVQRAARTASLNAQVVSLLGVFARLGTLSVGLFVALGVLQLEKTVTSLLAGIGVVGLALGFAFQDIASNFMSGLIMAIREPFQVGDIVETHDSMGTVERVSLRATVLRNFSGQLVVIPNKDVLQSPIVNYTQEGRRRVEVDVGVSYGDDLELAAGAARDAVSGLDHCDGSQPVEAIYTGFGASAIDLSVRFWIDLRREDASFLEARSDAVVAIKRAFDEAGLTIPFPIRTLDFGIHGGESFAAMLSAARDGDPSDAELAS